MIPSIDSIIELISVGKIASLVVILNISEYLNKGYIILEFIENIGSK